MERRKASYERSRESEDWKYSVLLRGKMKQVACGQIVARSYNFRDPRLWFGIGGYWVRFREDRRPQHGDSGGPVWNLRTGKSIGLV